MKVSQTMSRLLRIRVLEEEQSRLALEAAEAELHRLQTALAAAQHGARRGREAVTRSVHNYDVYDRIAGIEQIRTADRAAGWITEQRSLQQEETADRREAFLADRIERRQAESLLEVVKAQTALETEKRAQQALDDWHLLRTAGASGPVKRRKTRKQSEMPRIDSHHDPSSS